MEKRTTGLMEKASEKWGVRIRVQTAIPDETAKQYLGDPLGFDRLVRQTLGGAIALKISQSDLIRPCRDPQGVDLYTVDLIMFTGPGIRRFADSLRKPQKKARRKPRRDSP